MEWKDKIRAYFLHCMGQDSNQFYSAVTTTCEFYLKGVYQDIEVDDSIDEDVYCKMIWKLQVLKRCRSFMWLLKHHRFLTNHGKSRKGLGYASYKLCGSVCDDTLHVLQDCTKVMNTWKTTVSCKIVVEFFSLDMHNWIHFNLSLREMGTPIRGTCGRLHATKYGCGGIMKNTMRSL